MKLTEELAARLRQAIQGCAIHNHGPIQAWVAIADASTEGFVQVEEVAKLAIEACSQRIIDLQTAGVESGDPRIKKEEFTRVLIERLII